MKIYLDAQSIYSWLVHDVINGMQAKELLARREQKDPFGVSSSEDSSDEDGGNNGELISRGFDISECPLPLPFQGIDGAAVRTGKNYFLYLDLNDSKPRPFVNPGGIIAVPESSRGPGCFSEKDIRKLEKFYEDVAERVAKERWGEYVRLNDMGLDGYLVEKVRHDKYKSVLCVKRRPMTLEHPGFTRIRIGGNGISQRTFGDLSDFSIDLDYLSTFVTEMVNLSIQGAVKEGRGPNPNLDKLELRLGAPV